MGRRRNTILLLLVAVLIIAGTGILLSKSALDVRRDRASRRQQIPALSSRGAEEGNSVENSIPGTKSDQPSFAASNDAKEKAPIEQPKPLKASIPVSMVSFQCPITLTGAECDGHGECDTSIGSCKCIESYCGKACDVKVPASTKCSTPLSPQEPYSPLLSPRSAWEKLLTVIVPVVCVPHEVELARSCAVEMERVASIVDWLEKEHTGKVRVILSRLAEADETTGKDLLGPVKKRYGKMLSTSFLTLTKQQKSSMEAFGSQKKLGASSTIYEKRAWAEAHVQKLGFLTSLLVNNAVPTVDTPFTFLAAPETFSWSSGSINFPLLVDMMLRTDVDVLGSMLLLPSTMRSAAVKRSSHRRPLLSTTLEEMPEGEWLLHNPAVNLIHRRWILRHQKPPFGYERHQSFVMFSDRTSSSFIARSSILKELSQETGSLFNETLGSMYNANFFLSIKKRNEKLQREALHETELSAIAQIAPTRLRGYILVGTCGEFILPVMVPLHLHPEYFTSSTDGLASMGKLSGEFLNGHFAEAHQVEMYEDFFGVKNRRLVCVKSGGIYGHSKAGLFAPLCHRYQRQRDFVFLSNLWAGKHSPLNQGKKGRHSAISLHHGNIFGALRLNVELLWETDGDIDFISFQESHEELIARFEKLQRLAEDHGFQTKMTYAEKPWYVAFTRDKTDFQLNARSVKDSLTRGRPPQIHNVSVLYQGRRVFMNGFANPWKGVRADPGHDYRNAYLAQQGWVLQFTKKSVQCKSEGGFHNACLPNCNEAGWAVDHSRCTDDHTLPPAYRDPVLWLLNGEVDDYVPGEIRVREKDMPILRLLEKESGVSEGNIWSDLHNRLFD